MSAGFFVRSGRLFHATDLRAQSFFEIFTDDGHFVRGLEQRGLVLLVGSQVAGDAVRVFENEIGALRDVEVLLGQHEVGFRLALFGLEFDGQVDAAFEDSAFAVEVGLVRRGVVVEGQHDLQRTVAGRGVRVDDRGERVGVVGPLSGFREAAFSLRNL